MTKKICILAGARPNFVKVSPLVRAIEKYPEAENLIIDITNNSGGDDNYWKQNLVAPLGGDYSFSARTYIRKTELTDKYFSERATNDIPDDAPAWVEQLGLDRCLDNDWVLSDGSTEEKNAVGVYYDGDQAGFVGQDVVDEMYAAFEEPEFSAKFSKGLGGKDGLNYGLEITLHTYGQEKAKSADAPQAEK